MGLLLSFILLVGSLKIFRLLFCIKKQFAKSDLTVQGTVKPKNLMQYSIAVPQQMEGKPWKISKQFLQDAKHSSLNSQKK